MTVKYLAILTNQGAARLANAVALGTKLNITQMAVGDANGVLPTPDPAQTKLINQKRIASINTLSADPNNASQIIAEQIIPENEGGFWIREIGLFDDEGVLIAIANCPETYKPLLQEGSGRTQTIRLVLIVSSAASVTLEIDPAVVLATRQYVDNKVIEVKSYTDDKLESHLAAANPHPQYAPIYSPILTGTPKAPTQQADDSTTAIATTAFVKLAIAALVDSSPAALDTLNELAAAIGDDPNFATTMINALAGKQPLDSTLTALSGKSVSALLEYLGLGGIAGLGTPTGALASGIIRIPMYNGSTVETLILQWMAAPALAAGGNATITFPTGFPNALLSLMATGGATAAGVPGINTFSIGATSCRIYNQSTSASTQAGAIWALGK